MASSALDLAAAAAKIDTIGQVRAAMGAVTATLSQGYAKLSEISTIAGENAAAQSLLDTVNKSATILYNIYNDDPQLQDEEITTWHAHIAGQIVSEANDALKAVEDAANENLWDIAAIIEQALSLVGTAAGNSITALTNAVAAGGSAFVAAAWPTLLLVALAGGVAYHYRKELF
jgi:hypothetical protein